MRHSRRLETNPADLYRNILEALEPRVLLSGEPEPGLRIDVVLPGGGTTVESVQVGQVIPLEIWATITGRDETGENDGIQSVMGSLLSSNLGGGAALGTLRISSLGEFNGSASSRGVSADLDGDSDTDVGSGWNWDPMGFVAFRSPQIQFDGWFDGPAKRIKLGEATFTVEALLGDGATEIMFRPREAEAGALWVEDWGTKDFGTGNGASDSLRLGSSVQVLTDKDDGKPDTPAPPPGPNLPPSFTPTKLDFEVTGLAQWTIPGWATQISPGAGESTQYVQFIVTSSGDLQFRQRPMLTADGTLTFEPAPDQSGSATVRVVLVDNGGTYYGGSDSSEPVLFRIWGSTPKVNNAPSFAPGINPVVANTGEVWTMRNWAMNILTGEPWNRPSQQVEFVLRAESPELFSEQPSIDPSGTLRLRPAEGASGVTDIHVYLKDDGGALGGGVDRSDELVFQIIVRNPGEGDLPNEPPSFVRGSDQYVESETSPLVRVREWAARISPGSEAEADAGQRVRFVVWNSRPELFRVQPSIAPDGTLTYAPVKRAGGYAWVSVRLVDELGATSDSVHQYIEQFKIRVHRDPKWGSDDIWPTTKSDPFENGGRLDSGTPFRLLPGFDTITVQEDSGAYSQVIARGRTPSLAHTSGVIQTDNSALFSTQPYLAINGTDVRLRLGVAPNAFGTAHITAVVNTRAASDDLVRSAREALSMTNILRFSIVISPADDAPSGELTVSAITVGEPFELSALAMDPDGPVPAVRFFCDLDGNATLDQDVDLFLGNGEQDASGRWNWRGLAPEVGAGPRVFFAHALNQDAWTLIGSTQVHVFGPSESLLTQDVAPDPQTSDATAAESTPGTLLGGEVLEMQSAGPAVPEEPASTPPLEYAAPASFPAAAPAEKLDGDDLLKPPDEEVWV